MKPIIPAPGAAGACKFSQVRQDSVKQLLSNETLGKIAQNLHELEYSGRISPFGINEPLLDSRIVDIIKLFRSSCPKAFLSLNTNGDLLTEELYQKLIDAGLNALGISIYDNQGVKRLVKYTQDERVVLIDMRFPDRKLENRGGQLQKNTHLFQTENFINSPCYRPFNMLVIRQYGDVVLCCSDTYSDRVMGNVRSSRLEEIWSSKAFKSIRQELLTKGRANLNLCQNCSHNGTTSEVLYPMSAKLLKKLATT